MRKITKNIRIEWLILILLVLIGAIMSGSLLLRNDGIAGDSQRYLFPIHNLVDGKGYTYLDGPELYFPPGYGILSYGLFQVVNDVKLSGMFMSALSYLLLIPVAYFSTKSLFGRRAAILASVFVTFFPGILQVTFEVKADLTFTLIYLVCFTLYTRILLKGNSYLQSALLGVLLGYAYLIRAEAFLPALLVVASMIGLLFLRFIRGRSALAVSPIQKAEVYYPFITLVAFFLIALPYLLFLHRHVGHWTFSGKTVYSLLTGELVVEGLAHVDQLKVDRPEYWEIGYRVNLIDYIESRGIKFLKRIALNLRSEVRIIGELTFHAIVPFSIILLITLFVSSNKKRLLKVKLDPRMLRLSLAFLIFLMPLPVLLVFYVSNRYLLPYSTLILVLLAYLIVRLIAMNRWVIRKGWIHYVIISICLVSLFSASGLLTSRSSIYRTLRMISPVHSVRAAGIWLNEHVPDPDSLSIISSKKGDIMLYYASGERVPGGKFTAIYPNMTLDEAAHMLQTGQADYLVLTSQYVGRRPAMVTLWKQPERAQEFGLSLVHQDDDGWFQVYSSNQGMVLNP